METQILGLHHMTAIASDPQRNVDFYTGVLGLRLVKITVNFDDPSTYHLYYGDAQGSPGTILTFFPWPGAARGRQGSGQTTATTLAVPIGSLDDWRARLSEYHVSEPQARFGETVLSFQDHDGLPLELIGVPGDGGAILGMHSVTLTERRAEPTEKLLTETLGFRLVGKEADRRRYEVGAGGRGATVDVLLSPETLPGRVAAGTVHHIAWRTPDDDQQFAWQQTVARLGYGVSPAMDRDYFHSIYFREPGGVLFEIATDPPGFAVDEAPEALGTRLMLPPQYESQRAQIEKHLPPLRLPQ